MGSKNIQFCNYNFIDEDADLTYSSEDAVMVGDNVFSVVRSKVWNPTGIFEITASNKIMKINDGSAKTITLDEDTYTAAELATEMQTKLNASSSNWTVSYNTTTLKFVVSNTGSVTLTISDNTNAVWDTIGFTAGVDQTDTSFTPDEQRIHTSEWILVDNGTAQQVDAVCMVCPIDEIFGLSEDAVVRFQGNDVDSWDSPPLDVQMTITDRGIFEFYDQDVTDTEYRYHRIQFIDPTNPDGTDALRIGYLFIGQTTTITSSNVAQGFSKEQEDPSIEMVSESGQRYYDLRPKFERFQSLSIQNIAASDRVEIEQIYNDYGKHEPLFISLDPTTELETDASIYTKLMHFEGSPSFNHLFLTYYAVNFQLREAV